VDTLRVLIVGSPGDLERVSAALAQAGHAIVPVEDLIEASEALSMQRFDAVLLGAGVPEDKIPAFASKIKDLDRRAGTETKTAVLSVALETAALESKPVAGTDGSVPETIDPDALTLAIARLATAVGTDRANPGQQEFPVLDVGQLKEQVGFDDELLVELIDLFLSERLRQSVEMKEALAAGDCERLSRIAHTIKGSLGSLHAMAAKENAQNLELSAKARMQPESGRFLAALESDLDVLEGHLKAVQKSVNPS